MKQYGLFIAVGVGMLLSAGSSQASLTLGFTSVEGSSIQFNGSDSTFQINDNGDGKQWRIRSESGGPGSAAVGLYGWFTGSPWSYGAITTSLNGTQSATVNSSADFRIFDGALDGAQDLTGSIKWGQITTKNAQGGVNASLLVNISNLKYLGVNTDLQALLNSGSGTVDILYTLDSAKTLTDLSTGSAIKMIYGGTISAVPETTTLLSGASALGLLIIGMGLHSKHLRVIRVGKKQ